VGSASAGFEPYSQVKVLVRIELSVARPHIPVIRSIANDHLDRCMTAETCVSARRRRDFHLWHFDGTRLSREGVPFRAHGPSQPVDGSRLCSQARGIFRAGKSVNASEGDPDDRRHGLPPASPPPLLLPPPPNCCCRRGGAAERCAHNCTRERRRGGQEWPAGSGSDRCLHVFALGVAMGVHGGRPDRSRAAQRAWGHAFALLSARRPLCMTCVVRETAERCCVLVYGHMKW